MYLKTSLLGGIMILNLKNYLRIIRFHRHYKQTIPSFFQPLPPGKQFFIMQTNIRGCKCTPWLKVSINSIAFLLLRFLV